MNKIQEIATSAFFHKDGKLLVAKRASIKDFLPGKFELPGGRINFSEDLVVGLKREFQEELGLDVVVCEPFYAFTYMRDDVHTVEIDYFCELANPNAQIKLNPQDHSEFRWVTKKEVDEVWDKNDVSYGAIQKGFELLERQK